ncbi:hypothetical protein BDF19DRAFT_495426 [Syncephalis fuscata]|nr:hypothetical protein BDF19DRAFT_495426 [Syncephalis fuscata]
MNGFSSTRNLLEKAAAEYEDGKRKDAYSKYVAALNSLLFKLSGNKVVFIDSGEEPNAKAKELLKDSKLPTNKKSKRKKKRSRKRSGENVAEINESSAEEQSTDSDASSKQNNDSGDEENNAQKDAKDTVAERVLVRICDEHDEDDEHTVPLIPLSPLCRMYIVNTRRLAKSTRELTAAKGSRKDRTKSAPSLTVLRRLDEDMRIQRAKVDDVTAQITSIQDKTMLDWDPDQLARQWCIIDAALFSKVDVRRDLLTTLAESERVGRIFGDAVEACVDFERYVNSAVAHLLIIGAEEFRPGEMVIRVARTAHRLLHRYRNLNAFAGLIRALVCAPVRRLDRAWQNVPNRVRRLIQEYARALEPVTLHRRYMMLLQEALDDRRTDMGDNTGMALIPWMRPHCDMIRAWLRAYTTQRETRIMSELGMKKLDAMHATLEECQKYAGGTAEGTTPSATIATPMNSFSKIENHSVSRVGPRRRRGFVELDGTQRHLPAIGDLATLSDSDIGLQHWMSSRVYLTRAQLWEESIQIKPAGPGERMPARDAYRFIDDRNKYAEDDVPESGERGTTGRKRGLQAEAEIRQAWQTTSGSLRERPVSTIGQVEAILSPKPILPSAMGRTQAEEMAAAMADATANAHANGDTETAVNIDGSLMTVNQMLSFLDEEPAPSAADVAPSDNASMLPTEPFIDDEGRSLVDIAREEVLKRLGARGGFETIRSEVERLALDDTTTTTKPANEGDELQRDITPKPSDIHASTYTESGAATPVPRRRQRRLGARTAYQGNLSDPEDGYTATKTGIATGTTAARSRPQTMFAELERLTLNRESETAWLNALARQANEETERETRHS